MARLFLWTGGVFAVAGVALGALIEPILFVIAAVGLADLIAARVFSRRAEREN